MRLSGPMPASSIADVSCTSARRRARTHLCRGRNATRAAARVVSSCGFRIVHVSAVFHSSAGVTNTASSRSTSSTSVSAARTRAELDVVLRDLPSFRRWQLAGRRRKMLAAFVPPLRLLWLISPSGAGAQRAGREFATSNECDTGAQTTLLLDAVQGTARSVMWSRPANRGHLTLSRTLACNFVPCPPWVWWLRQTSLQGGPDDSVFTD
jgi:hypothetical protein